MTRPVARANARGNRAHRLDREHARQVCELVHCPRGSRFDECHRVILALRDVELHVENHFDRVEREHADDQNGDGEGDSQRREPGADGLALQVSQNHLHRRRSEPARQRAFEPRDGVARGRLGPHRLGRRKPHGAHHGADRAERACRQADDRALHDKCRREHVSESREAEEIVIEGSDRAPEPDAAEHAKHRPGKRNRHRP